MLIDRGNSQLDRINDMIGPLSGALSGDDEDAGGRITLIVIALVVAALVGGVLLTMALIKRYAGTLPLPERNRYQTAVA